jgi:hypothetical protein
MHTQSKVNVQVKMYRKGKISFEHVVTFNMDEYCGISTQTLLYLLLIRLKKQTEHVLVLMSKGYRMTTLIATILSCGTISSSM